MIKEAGELGLNKDIDNFINISGKETSNRVWRYMDYGFNHDKMKIFIKAMKEKGLKIINIDNLKYILKRFIDNREEALLIGNRKRY